MSLPITENSIRSTTLQPEAAERRDAAIALATTFFADAVKQSGMLKSFETKGAAADIYINTLADQLGSLIADQSPGFAQSLYDQLRSDE